MQQQPFFQMPHGQEIMYPNTYNSPMGPPQGTPQNPDQFYNDQNQGYPPVENYEPGSLISAAAKGHGLSPEEMHHYIQNPIKPLSAIINFTTTTSHENLCKPDSNNILGFTDESHSLFGKSGRILIDSAEIISAKNGLTTPICMSLKIPNGKYEYHDAKGNPATIILNAGEKIKAPISITHSSQEDLKGPVKISYLSRYPGLTPEKFKSKITRMNANGRDSILVPDNSPIAGIYNISVGMGVQNPAFLGASYSEQSKILTIPNSPHIEKIIDSIEKDLSNVGITHADDIQVKIAPAVVNGNGRFTIESTMRPNEKSLIENDRRVRGDVYMKVKFNYHIVNDDVEQSKA